MDAQMNHPDYIINSDDLPPHITTTAATSQCVPAGLVSQGQSTAKDSSRTNEGADQTWGRMLWRSTNAINVNAVASQKSAVKANAAASQKSAVKANAAASQKSAVKVVFKRATFKKPTAPLHNEDDKAKKPTAPLHNEDDKAKKTTTPFHNEDDEASALALVACVRGAKAGSDESKTFFKAFNVSFGTLFKDAAHPQAKGMSDKTKVKIALIDNALKLLSTTRCKYEKGQAENFVVEVITPLLNEEMSGMQTFLHPGMSFKVHDTPFFNTFFRMLQNHHALWPRNNHEELRSTKPVTEMFDLVGLGPHADSSRWNGRNGDYRGPKMTDPQPKVGALSGVRDGCYFKQYDFCQQRLITAVERCVHYKGAPGQLRKEGVRALKKKALAEEALVAKALAEAKFAEEATNAAYILTAGRV
jgi:hypothetical protein